MPNSTIFIFRTHGTSFSIYATLQTLPIILHGPSRHLLELDETIRNRYRVLRETLLPELSQNLLLLTRNTVLQERR